MARFLMIAIAFSGTALVADLFYTLRLIPDYIDPLIKRAGIPMVVATTTLYCMSLVSNRIRILSETYGDRKLLGYELCFYASCAALILFTSIYWLGFPFENCIRSKAVTAVNLDVPECLSYDVPTRIGGVGKLSPEILKLLTVLDLVSLIWFIAFLACITSRYFQWRWVEAGRESI